MRIAITGATGFLGRYLVHHLAQAGHQLRCWYRPSSDRSGFDDVAHAIEWLPGSLDDRAATASLVRGVDAVVHAALQWQGRGSFRISGNDDLEAFLEANLMGSLRLFQAAHTAGVARFVFISSCAVHEVILGDRPLDEAHPLWAKSHYGAHKGALEKFVHSFGLGEGWPICALRPTGIYGLARPAGKSRWFDLVGQVLRGEAIETARGGKEVHAADVAKAIGILLNAEAKAISGQAFNCYDRYIAEQEVARIAKELTGSKSTVADLNKGPKNQIVTEKLRALGMTFGGEPLLRQTIAEVVQAHRVGAEAS
ncbi:MAG TPA: NAD(P)-dependent oxidoreductase [Gemmataceae bacterium]|nr:NAD(P)-dependent oxidoreductase [Gemmataceae bacterium]